MRLLRRDGYRLITASGANEGLAVLEREPVQVIVSDQRMPEMTGVEFLRRVEEKSREILLNLQVLQISQEVLEQGEGALPGQEAAQWLPPAAFTACDMTGAATSFDTASASSSNAWKRSTPGSRRWNGMLTVPSS